MKGDVWVYILNDRDQSFIEIDGMNFLSLLAGEEGVLFPDYGGKMVRGAIVHMQCDNDKAVGVEGIEFRRCQLTAKGGLDPHFREKRKQMESEMASMKPAKRKKAPPNVVDASKRFKERRFRNEFSWTPTVSMVQRLAELIQDRSNGHTKSKDALYQILNMTATG
ncbi:MAG: hypothetical protein R3231_02710 [bacterium]|nr:hypothetical protein [bacterium]